MIKDIGFKKCCGPTLTLPLSSNMQPMLVSNEQLRAVMREECNRVVLSLPNKIDKVEQSLSSISEQLKDHNKRILTCESNFTDVFDRVTCLETKIIEMEKSSFQNDEMSVCLEEWENRFRRKNNAIIFGLTEHAPENAEGNDDDKSLVIQLLGIICPDSIPDDSFKCVRIGFLSQTATKPRPLKLMFQNSNQSTMFREAYFKLKTKDLLPLSMRSIQVSPDKTKLQQAEYRRVKGELEGRKSKGETDIVIQFRHGVPHIVKSRQHQPTQNMGALQIT